MSHKAIIDAAFDAAKDKSYRKGYKAGLVCGGETADRIFRDMTRVTKVVHNGYVTVVYFGDGMREKVTYNPGYGYAYDGEKAVMAAMLKHLTRGGYIRVLEKFEGSGRKANVYGNTPAGFDRGSRIVTAADIIDFKERYQPDGPLAEFSRVVSFGGMPLNDSAYAMPDVDDIFDIEEAVEDVSDNFADAPLPAAGPDMYDGGFGGDGEAVDAVPAAPDDAGTLSPIDIRDTGDRDLDEAVEEVEAKRSDEPLPAAGIDTHDVADDTRLGEEAVATDPRRAGSDASPDDPDNDDDYVSYSDDDDEFMAAYESMAEEQVFGGPLPEAVDNR